MCLFPVYKRGRITIITITCLTRLSWRLIHRRRLEHIVKNSINVRYYSCYYLIFLLKFLSFCSNVISWRQKTPTCLCTSTCNVHKNAWHGVGTQLMLDKWMKSLSKCAFCLHFPLLYFTLEWTSTRPPGIISCSFLWPLPQGACPDFNHGLWDSLFYYTSSFVHTLWASWRQGPYVIHLRVPQA